MFGTKKIRIGISGFGRIGSGSNATTTQAVEPVAASDPEPVATSTEPVITPDLEPVATPKESELPTGQATPPVDTASSTPGV